jgi:hypothetical protein
VRAALGLPASAAELPDLVPPGHGEQLASGYLDQVWDILPIDGLLGRDAELADLVAFCAGNAPYAWWQAGPWAGKHRMYETEHSDATVLAEILTIRNALLGLLLVSPGGVDHLGSLVAVDVAAAIQIADHLLSSWT